MHGLDLMVDEGRVRVCVSQDGDDIVFRVRDNGVGMSREQVRAIQVLERLEDIFFVGFDSNVVTIDGLQDGCVDALIVQNPYAMGYLGVESAYKLLTGQGGGLKAVVDTSTQIVDRKNIFTMDGQKALLPLTSTRN